MFTFLINRIYYFSYLELEADADGLPTSAGKQWLKEEALTWTAGMPEGKRVASSRLPPISPFLALLPNSTIAHITVGQMLRMYGSGGVQEGTKTARWRARNKMAFVN